MMASEPDPNEAPAASSKVEVRLQASGDAPIMKQRKYKIEGEKKLHSVIQFIRKYLKLSEEEALFLYVNQAFSPSPDELLSHLYECYGSDGKLVLYYAKTQMWG